MIGDQSRLDGLVHGHTRGRTVDSADVPASAVLEYAYRGLSVRQISYLTGVPRSTVQDMITRQRNGVRRAQVREPAPFYRFIEERR